MTPRLDRTLIYLGHDTERMSEADARRQHATVDRLLSAFFGHAGTRAEVQLLADEVGLGKTFVALATAYATLAAARQRTEDLPPDLGRCFRAAVVVTPGGNHALSAKWVTEAEALRTRCSLVDDQTRWFRSKLCTSIEELVQGLRRATDLRRDPEKAPCVLVCEANLFTKRMRDAADRLRFLAASLFRWWGSRLCQEERYQVVRRAEEVHGFGDWAGLARRVGKATYTVDLWDFQEQETYLSPAVRAKWDWPPHLERLYEQTPFTYAQVAEALERFSRTPEGHDSLSDCGDRVREGVIEPRGLLPYCKWVADRRGRAEWYFEGFKERLLDLYRELTPLLLQGLGRFLPLVIVDEAHHWRHSHRQDCKAFRRFLAPLARRLLLLTATPFQLHRDELQEILATVDSMEPAIGTDRVKALQACRQTLAEAMNASEEAGTNFSRAWGELNDQMTRLRPEYATTLPRLPRDEDPRTLELAKHWKTIRDVSAKDRTGALLQVPGTLRSFFTRALQLGDANLRLQGAMAPLVIRHRRQTAHRRYWVGKEYPPAPGRPLRPDQSQLHLAPGLAMPAQSELAQYLLMKVVAAITRGKHRTALGMDLTGCYTTLWKSREGCRAIEKAAEEGDADLLPILKRITGHGRDPNPRDADHPKVAVVAEEVLRRWEQGEKSLIFCFRVPTAEALHRILSRHVDERLRKARRALFVSRGTDTGGDFDADRAMQGFRRSLTSREGSGVPLFIDRVLLGWLDAIGVGLPAVTDEEMGSLASLCARATHNGQLLFPDFDRPDRVFISRAVEQILAKRLLDDPAWLTCLPPPRAEDTGRLLRQAASDDWVRFRYAATSFVSTGEAAVGHEGGRAEQMARTSLAARYDLLPHADPRVQQTILDALRSRPVGGRASILETLLSGPNLFVPLGEARELLGDAGRVRVRRMCDLLWKVTRRDGGWEWDERAHVLDAVVRAMLREDIVLRLPQSVFQGKDETWSESLLRGFHEVPPGGGQLEPLAARVEEFLRELSEMGHHERQAHLRYSMNPKAESVVLVTGTNRGDRESVFNGFNTPLLPDILICTEVGQEGIDLHRHCRHVVHFDLGWNPAATEQRTGRTDRIGSKTLRERKLACERHCGGGVPEDQLPGLDVALPYLAGTYDERMFDRLRTRAQVFDILTGGDPTADESSSALWLEADSEGRDDESRIIPLPREMLDDLRVDLAVLSS